MFLRHYTEVPSKPVAMEGAEEVTIREVITEREGAPTFKMRVFEIAPGGHTPMHEHDYEHEIFILDGAGEVTIDRNVHELVPGSTALIMPSVRHQFRNPGEGPLRFLCYIPVREKC